MPMTIKNAIKGFALRENETILKVVRHDSVVIFPHVFVCFLILILDFFLMYYLFLQGWWGVALFGGVIIVVLFYVLRVLFLYRANQFIVTNQRIVDVEQAGIFEKFINEFSYSKIVEAKASVKGVGPTIFHYGDIRLSLRDDLGPYELYKIPAALELQNFINGLIEQAAPKTPPSGVSPVAMIMAEVRLLSPADQEEVIRQIEVELAEDEARGKSEKA